MVVTRIDQFTSLGWREACVAVGNFDGLHLGHQALTAAVCDRAGALGGVAGVLTFDPHPARVLRPGQAPAALVTLAQKARLLEAARIQNLAVLPFDARVAGFSAEDFARRVLRETLDARVVVVGENFRFGHGRAAGVSELRALGERLGFEVLGVAPVRVDGRAVSSTRVREAVEQGNVAAAGTLLGRPYEIEGLVARGDGVGRQLGFPTANLEPHNELLPRHGVYAARCNVPGRASQPAVVNIGRRPTFDGREVRVEAHLIDFQGDLYAQNLGLEFIMRLRDEQRFGDRFELSAQIERDIQHARHVLEPAR